MFSWVRIFPPLHNYLCIHPLVKEKSHNNTEPLKFVNSALITMYSLPVWQRDNWPVWTVDISAHPLSHLSCCFPHTKTKADTSQLITNPIDLPGTQNPLKRNYKTNAKAGKRYFPPFSHWQSKTRLVVMFWRLQTFQTIYSRVFYRSELKFVLQVILWLVRNYMAEPVNMTGCYSKIISRPHAGFFLLIYKFLNTRTYRSTKWKSLSTQRKVNSITRGRMSPSNYPE